MEREGHVPITISLFSVNVRVLDGCALPIRHRQDDGLIDSCEFRPIEFQKIFRYVQSGVREEDLVVLLYFLLASAYGSDRRVETWSPVIFAVRRFVADGRDEEIVEFLEESSARFGFISIFFRAVFVEGTPNHVPIEAEIGDFVGVV